MNPENKGNGPDSSSNTIFKRKRGRPRKDQNQNISRIANIISKSNQIHGRGDHTPVASGNERENGNRSHQENAVDLDHNDDASIVGQPVSGVVEAIFDAGYLLSVRVGNSDMNLRGVVFKPGHYLPVSSENDVAPHIHMIRRNAVPFPTRSHTPVHGSYRRGRGRGRARSESRLSYSTNGSSANLAGDRGTVMPVVLQPADVSNGVNPVMEAPTLVSQPAHLAASRARVLNRTESSSVEKDLGIDSSFTGKLSGAVKEELISETRNESAQLTDVFTPEQMRDLSPPLSVEPLQAIHSDFFNQSSSVSQNFREARAGKMTELLLAVQEKQATNAQHHNVGQQPN